MEGKWYGVEEQRQRRKRIYDLVYRNSAPFFDRDGIWVGAVKERGVRERLWYAMIYLETGGVEAVELANRIIVSTTYRKCHFAPMAAVQLLIKYEPLLSEEAKTGLFDYTSSMIDHFTGKNMDFVGVNDNFPCMSTYFTLFGGELLGRRDAVEIAQKRLLQLQALLTRRGFPSEHTSPTYSAIQVYALAEIASHARNDSLRKLAQDCEARVWMDMLGHYHPAMHQMTGPYSRAYPMNSVGHLHYFSYALYALLGERLEINPMNTIFADQEAVAGLVIDENIPYMQLCAAWIAGADYRCPASLIDHALNKTFPYTIKGTVEFSSSTDAPPGARLQELYGQDDFQEYPACSGTVTTYMTEEYALGSATNEFHNGSQTDSFHLLYRRRASVSGVRDVGSVYARYLVNDKQPDQSDRFHPTETQMLWDEGRKIAVQRDNSVLMLYKPKAYGRHNVSSLKLSLLLYSPSDMVDEIWLGDDKLEEFEGKSLVPCPVFIKERSVYMAFYPLTLTDHGREAAVKVERVGSYTMISFYNYEGEVRNFAQKEFLLTGNGFVAEIRSEEEFGNFGEFRKAMADFRVDDTLLASEHSRGTHLRRCRYEREGLTLECEYSPISEGIKYIAFNGRVPSQEKLFVTGMDVNQLPFMT